MEELGSFSQIVERIYDASLDSTLWPGALQHICAFVQGCSGVLFYRSVGSDATSLFHSWGEDLRFFDLYQKAYSKIDPFFPSILFLDVGRVHASNDLIPAEEFRATRFYQEWVKPQGILDALHSNLERTSTGAAALAIRRKERDGLFDADAKARFGLIVPHVRRAVAIGKVLDFHQAKEAAFSSTLDHLDAGLFLVGSDGRLVHLNQTAAAMLAAGDVLRAPHGRLMGTDARANMELQDAIAAAARGDAGLGEKGIAISLRSDGEKTSQIAHVLSLTSGTRRHFMSSQATAALFVREMVAATPSPLEVMARRYGLTAGEVRVVAALAASSGVADIAKMLGIGEATVRTHLRHIFAKTGARRQADVVRLLSNTPT